ncbi:MAG: hypothetical protein AAF085_08515, partial [Planctomycetota bacterium]
MFLLSWHLGCGGQSQETLTQIDDTETLTSDDQATKHAVNEEAAVSKEGDPSEIALGARSGETSETDTSEVTIKPLDQKTLDGLAVHTFPDGTRFCYPQDFLIGGLGAEVGVHSHASSQLAYVVQLPANGETDPAGDWILEHHDELVSKKRFFNNGFERSPIEQAKSPTASFAKFTCKLVQPDGIYYASKHSISIINDRVYLIWSLDREPKGIDGEDSLASSLTRAVGGLIDQKPDLVATITKTLAPGEPLEHEFVNSQPKLVRTFIGGDIHQPRYTNRRPKIMAYSLHPDGTLCIGEPVAMQARTGLEDPELVLVPKDDNQGKAFTGRWSEQDGKLTLVWDNLSRTYDIQVREHSGEQLIIFDGLSGHSRQPFILREHKPLVWFKGDPGAPMVVEEVQEKSDAPLTVPVVDPVVTNPTPTVTDTPIPTQLVGQQFAGGKSGGPLGNQPFVAEVFGSKSKAQNVAYVIDASGSMVDVLPFVVKEVSESISEVRDEQNVTVIVFSG